MKKRKKILCTINMGIFPATVLFAYQMTHEEILKKLLTWPAEEWYWHAGIKNDQIISDRQGWGCAIKRVVENGDQIKTLYYIVVKNRFRFDDFDYSSLAHEVLHICQFFLPEVLDRNKEIEAEAYLHSHLMQTCLKAIRQAK